ncbi:MAG: FAD-dependent oxidoreductase [Planctomycetes bacterium]|nr:FAD-dependent oxidoreductase [Planctomycetota bacterium]HPF13192.1 FAD-dependent oxidoreductase [Planctomycetota bacterium]
MKVAIVGTGISGLVASHRLAGEHDLTVFEAGDYIGGHTHTVDVQDGDRKLAVDTGFIVFNEKTYPNFCGLMHQLGVPYRESEMSFSVRCEATRLEYNGTSLNGLFAQRRNLVSPRFWRMTRDIVRFYKEAPEVLRDETNRTTLGEFLERGGYSQTFVEKHLIPMSAAIWSARPEVIRRFPLRFLVQFFHNHGFLQIQDRPVWQVIAGGSREYIEPMTRPYRDRIRLRTPVVGIRREADQVLVETAQGEVSRFDRVVLACHSDQALAMLRDATPREREILGAFAYQRNEATLHTDSSLMPQTRRAWASWNYHVTQPASDLPTVTYWMNELQRFQAAKDYFVTLNRTADIDPNQVLRQIVYHHPIYSQAAVDAQARHHEIDGVAGVHFAGAYWGYGFHEDGVKSGLRAAERVEQGVPVP